MRNISSNVFYWTVGPWSVALFGEAVESVGGGALQKEVVTAWGALRTFSSVPLLVLSLSCLGGNVTG